MNQSNEKTEQFENTTKTFFAKTLYICRKKNESNLRIQQGLEKYLNQNRIQTIV